MVYDKCIWISMGDMAMVTKELLDQALEAWALARNRAVLEQTAWGNVLKSHDLLIASLRANGHSWSQAQNEFKKISDAHSRA